MSRKAEVVLVGYKSRYFQYSNLLSLLVAVTDRQSTARRVFRATYGFHPLGAVAHLLARGGTAVSWGAHPRTAAHGGEFLIIAQSSGLSLSTSFAFTSSLSLISNITL